jgi:hypothetical protein
MKEIGTQVDPEGVDKGQSAMSNSLSEEESNKAPTKVLDYAD